MYFTHKTYSDFKRRILVCYRNGIAQFALLVYAFDKDEHDILLTPHGNSKKSKGFTRNMFSVRDKIASDIDKLSAGDIYEDAFDAAGGILQCNNATEYVRNKKQIYNVKQNRKEKSDSDQLAAVIAMKNNVNSSILNVHQTKHCSLMICLATKFQLKAMEEFCTQKEKFGIFGVDMTYNCGQFYVTPTTIRHPMLVHERTLVEPTLLGPTIIHTHHSESTYKMFAADLINANSNLRNLKFIGSDRAMEVANGFHYHMPEVGTILCKKHAEDNISRYLSSKAVAMAHKNDIFNDIFKDLAGCTDVRLFEEQLNALKPKWDAIHEDIYPWFKRYQVESFKNGLIQAVRNKAGLGTKFYYNNSNESINKLLKTKLNRQSTLPELIKEYESIAQTQENNCSRAIFAEGQYCLKAEYKH